MAIVLYKCDTCKREIQKLRNPKGIEVVGRCVITLGCRGKLYQTDLLEDFSRASIPADVVGLDNYQQRRVVYNHTQQRLSNEWIIPHNLGTSPSVSVFVDTPTSADPNARTEVIPQDLVTVSADVVRLVFTTPQSGIAQLVARSTDPQLFQPTFVADDDNTLVQITNNSTLTLATRVDDNGIEPATVRLQIIYTTPNSINVPFDVTLDGVPDAVSPWSQTDRALVRGKLYKVRSVDPISAAIQSGLVPEGSTFRITGISRDEFATVISPVQEKTAFILLAQSPYGGVDRIFDQAIDLIDISITSATKQVILENLDLQATAATVQTIHPLIRSL